VENNLSRYASCLHESVYTFYVFFLVVSFVRCRSVDLVWLGLVFFCVDGKGFCFGASLCEGFISQRGTSYDGSMYQEF
jgi:hypothetical protein